MITDIKYICAGHLSSQSFKPIGELITNHEGEVFVTLYHEPRTTFWVFDKETLAQKTEDEYSQVRKEPA